MNLHAQRAILWIILVTAFALVSQRIDNASGEQRRGVHEAAASTAGVDTSDRAPTGAYTAATGASAGTASGTVTRGRAREASASSGTSGGTITMNIGSYSTREEVDQVVAAQGSGAEAMLQAINKTSHGSVTIGGQTFAINMAASAKVGSSYNIYLVSAKPFSTSASSSGRSPTGGSAGYIQLTVSSDGGGDGKLYASTQIVVDKDGSVVARGGASTATALVTH